MTISANTNTWILSVLDSSSLFSSCVHDVDFKLSLDNFIGMIAAHAKVSFNEAVQILLSYCSMFNNETTNEIKAIYSENVTKNVKVEAKEDVLTINNIKKQLRN